MKKSDKPLILVDGSSYLYRAFHALPPLSNSKGQPTGAAYGVLNMLKSMITELEPDQMVVVFDAKGKTFRDDLYKDYKANRPPMPNDLRTQIEPLHAMIKAMGIPLMVIEGVEADDVIGSLACQATASGMETLISTGDKDMAQLVNAHVTLVNTMTNTTMDAEGVEAKFGVPPALIIDYLALIGDTVDNVPGVAKCGPKTALKWLQEYGDLDGVMANADKIKGKVGENLREALEHLPLSKTLVTIKQDLDFSDLNGDLSLREADKDALTALYKEMEFKTWLSQLLGEAEESAEPSSYDVVLKEKDFANWLKRLERADIFSFDTETTSLNYMEADIVGVSFAVNSGEAAYVPVAHQYDDVPQQLTREKVLEALRPLLEDPKRVIVGQNLKYDISVLARYGIHMPAPKYDTMLESYVLNSTGSRHDMDSLALKYLGVKTIKFEEVAGKGAKQVTFDKVPLAEAGPYAAEDADITLQLHNTLWPKLEKEKTLSKVFTDIEMPLMPVLSKMERRGILVDGGLLEKQSEALGERIGELEEQAFELAGKSFNLASPKQLREILFTDLALPIRKKTPKGEASTAEEVLQDLAFDFPLPKIILEYRSLSKLKSTYTDKLPQQINPHTGRVHSSFHQAVTATGRLSSSDPNLQNIPVRTPEGRKIREAFIVPEGYRMIALDYSQIELRIMAHLSGDKGLLNAFANDMDVHSATAAEVFGVAVEDVSAEQRRSAKAINFGLIYGMSSFGLAKQLGVDRKSAQAYIDTYFTHYPGVQEYMDIIREQASSQGYVETVLGRRLYLPEINASNQMRRKAAERTAVNAPMQGTAADIIKLAMVDVDRWLQQHKVDAHLVLQVHDELVLEVPEDAVDEIITVVSQRMSEAVTLDVPLIVDTGIGSNWQEAH